MCVRVCVSFLREENENKISDNTEIGYIQRVKKNEKKKHFKRKTY